VKISITGLCKKDYNETGNKSWHCLMIQSWPDIHYTAVNLTHNSTILKERASEERISTATYFNVWKATILTSIAAQTLNCISQCPSICLVKFYLLVLQTHYFKWLGIKTYTTFARSTWYTCERTCTHTHTHTHKHTHIHINTHIYMRTPTHTCEYTHTHINRHTHTHLAFQFIVSPFNPVLT
jgi:hypothetical protein